MQLAIVGGGPIGLGTAILAQSCGHSAVVWSPSGSLGSNRHRNMEAAGVLEGNFILDIATELETALSNADAVMLAVPANAHSVVIDSVVPYLRASQLVILWAQSSLSALYLSKRCAQRDIVVPIAMWSGPLIGARRTGDHQVTVSTIRPRIGVAALPHRLDPEAVARCVSFFGSRFVTSPVLDVVLSNVNPVMHLPQALCNLTRIERGEIWSAMGNTTASVARLIDALDAERLRVAESLGVAVLTLPQFLHRSFPGLPLTSIDQQAPTLAARLLAAGDGPRSLQTRFIDEDIPFGAVTIEVLAQVAGLRVPLHCACIDVFESLLKRDFRRENTMINDLHLLSRTKSDLLRILSEGWKE